jgi:hypothetical protein
MYQFLINFLPLVHKKRERNFAPLKMVCIASPYFIIFQLFSCFCKKRNCSFASDFYEFRVRFHKNIYTISTGLEAELWEIKSTDINTIKICICILYIILEYPLKFSRQIWQFLIAYDNDIPHTKYVFVRRKTFHEGHCSTKTRWELMTL